MSFLDEIKREFNVEEVDIRTYSPLTLAFIGDCIFDQIIRTLLVLDGNRSVESLHKHKSKIVKASAQAEFCEVLMPVLTEKEISVFKRGRNAKSGHLPKNASQSDYHKATGFEALFGYLYLSGELDRIRELFTLINGGFNEEVR